MNKKLEINNLKKFRKPIKIVIDKNRRCFCGSNKFVICYKRCPNEILAYKCNNCGTSIFVKEKIKKFKNSREIGKMLLHQKDEKIEENIEYENILLTKIDTDVKLSKLQKEIIYMLRTLLFNDRKIRTIAIGLNPKFKRMEYKNQEGTIWFEDIILKNLNILKKVGLVRNQKGLWSLEENLKFKEKELSDIEKKILIFINKRTLNKEYPKKVKLNEDDRIGRAKIRYMEIRVKKRGIYEKKEKRFTKNDIEFDKALNTLKARKLITSRTKDQTFPGLTCTEIGYKLAIQLN